MIEKPGIYDVAEADYHADPCPTPSLSASLVKVLDEFSPYHAWVKHPRLNPEFEAENKKTFDLGKVSHALLLRDDGARIRRMPSTIADAKGNIRDFTDWKLGAAKQMREDAYAEGFTPVMAHEFREVERMVAAARMQIDQVEKVEGIRLFKDGKPEQSMFWIEETPFGPIWCRARLDWLPSLAGIFADYKTTGATANPERADRRAVDMGWDIQAAMYRRGIRKVLGVEMPDIRFFAQENFEPFAACPIGFTHGQLDEVEATVVWPKICLFARCLHDCVWPGYPARTCWVDIPAFKIGQREERLEREKAVSETGRAMFDQLAKWQAPHNQKDQAA